MGTPAELHREFVDAWNRRDFDCFARMLHPEYTYTGANGVELPGGPAAGIASAKAYAEAFPDAQTEVEEFTSSDRSSCGEFLTRGTHTGSFAGAPPTGKPVAIKRCNVIDVRDGLIYRERDYMDTATLMKELGLV